MRGIVNGGFGTSMETAYIKSLTGGDTIEIK